MSPEALDTQEIPEVLGTRRHVSFDQNKHHHSAFFTQQHSHGFQNTQRGGALKDGTPRSKGNGALAPPLCDTKGMCQSRYYIRRQKRPSVHQKKKKLTYHKKPAVYQTRATIRIRVKERRQWRHPPPCETANAIGNIYSIYICIQQMLQVT